MLSCRKATMPPANIITNSTSISTRCRNENSINAFIGHGSWSPSPSVAHRGRPVDEQAAAGDHVLARLQSSADLDHAAVDHARLDLAPLDRLLVFVCHPDTGGSVLVDHRLARDRGPQVALVREDAHA